MWESFLSVTSRIRLHHHHLAFPLFVSSVNGEHGPNNYGTKWSGAEVEAPMDSQSAAVLC